MPSVGIVGIGADPEFIFSQDGEKVSAADFLQFSSDFGCDGHNATAELRPKYAKSSVGLTANIKTLIRDGLFKVEGVRNLDFLSGHYKHDEPIGGHIHLSFDTGKMIDLEELGRHLDLTMETLSDCIDDLDERSERRSDGYGSGWRLDHGPRYIEYRAPGSWLLSPQVTFINLWLAEATAIAYTNKQRRPFEVMRELGKCAGILAFAQGVKGVPDKEIFLKAADKVFGHLPLSWEEDFKKNWGC